MNVRSSSQSLAEEIVYALLFNMVTEWIVRRWITKRGKDLYRYLFCADNRRREAVGEKLLREFAESVADLRLTGCTKNEFLIQGDEHSEGVPVRHIYFTIGRDRAESLVVLRVVVRQQRGDLMLGLPKKHVDHWSSWQPSFHNAVECVQHHDSKFVGRVILGRLATR